MVRRLIRNVAVAKACGQYVRGILAVERSARPVSTMCRCFLSDKPLCSGVCGGDVRWEMPCSAR